MALDVVWEHFQPTNGAYEATQCPHIKYHRLKQPHKADPVLPCSKSEIISVLSAGYCSPITRARRQSKCRPTSPRGGPLPLYLPGPGRDRAALSLPQPCLRPRSHGCASFAAPDRRADPRLIICRREIGLEHGVVVGADTICLASAPRGIIRAQQLAQPARPRIIRRLAGDGWQNVGSAPKGTRVFA